MNLKLMIAQTTVGGIVDYDFR